MRSTQTLIRGVTMLAWLTMVLLVTECHAQGSQAGPAQSSPPSCPPIKPQPFRRFPSRSSPLKSGGFADFAPARRGLPSVRSCAQQRRHTR